MKGMITHDSWESYVEDLFTFQPPVSKKQIKLYEDIRSEFKQTALFIIENVPQSPQREQAIHHLHLVSMLCNAGIALNSDLFVDEE